MKDPGKSEYSRVEVTSLLLSHQYKPTVMKSVSHYFDVYVKEGVSPVQLPKDLKVFRYTELETLLPRELLEGF